MSVINQVLLNLEKRRASPAERGVLPDHVQVLPEDERTHHRGWVAAGIAVAIAVLAAWIALSRPAAERARSPAPRAGAESAIERMLSATAGVRPSTRPDEPGDVYLQELRAFRLSLELANPPAEPTPRADATAPQAAAGDGEPIRSARVIGRLGAEPATDAAPAGAATPGRSEAGSRAAAASAKSAADAATRPPEIRKEMRADTPSDLAENEYRKAVTLLNLGRLADAEAGFREALSVYPEHHNARQGLLGLLVHGRKLDEAERVLEEGVRLSPGQTGFNMTLARLQAERGDNVQATATLQRGLEHAQGSAEYAAFLAALLQRQGRHEEAIDQFHAALRLRPGSGVWWLGLGISLQATNRGPAAQEAYRQARAAGNLQPDLAALAEQRLRQLQ
jgi:MSHA biogenesis protein MshN